MFVYVSVLYMCLCIKDEGQDYKKFACSLAEDTKAISTHLHAMLACKLQILLQNGGFSLDLKSAIALCLCYVVSHLFIFSEHAIKECFVGTVNSTAPTPALDFVLDEITMRAS